MLVAFEKKQTFKAVLLYKRDDRERYNKVCVTVKVNYSDFREWLKSFKNRTFEDSKCTTAPDGSPFTSSNEKSPRILRFPFDQANDIEEIVISFAGKEVAQIALLEVEGR